MPLTGQMKRPLPPLIGPAGRPAAPPPCSCAWTLSDSFWSSLEVGLQRLALGADLAQRVGLAGPRLRVAHPRADQLVLDDGDLVAALEHDRGQLLLARLELVQARGGARRVGLRVAHELDDRVVLVLDAAEELAALQQVGEAVGVQHHGHQVGLVGRVQLGQPPRQDLAPLGQAHAQPGQTGALAAQVLLGLHQLGAARVQVFLDPALAGLQLADRPLQPVDLARPALDVGRQDVLGALAAADLASGRLDLLLQGGGAALGRLGPRAQRQDEPQRGAEDQRQDGTGQQVAQAHAGRMVGGAAPRPCNSPCGA